MLQLDSAKVIWSMRANASGVSFAITSIAPRLSCNWLILEAPEMQKSKPQVLSVRPKIKPGSFQLLTV